jgi:ABC-2 type transport system permease protein
MSARRAVWEVARRELVERSRSRVLRISLVLMLILAIGGAVAAARLSGRTPTDNIGIVGARSVALEPAIQLQARAVDRRVRLHELASAAAARRAVRDGSIDVALLDGTRMVVKRSRSQPAVRVVWEAAAAQTVLDRLRRSGLSQAQALSALAPRRLPVAVLEPNARNTEQNRTLIAVGLLTLFVVLAFFGQAVAQGVTEEKSSRVIELLLTTLPPRRLLAGKVLGIGLLGLVLLLLPGAAALAAGSLAGGAGLPSAAPETIGLVLLWFVLGYVFYSVAFAAVGALVSRQEDLQTAMLPVNAVLIAGFYLALIASGNPNGTVARVAAFVPPFAPMVVPMRMVLGDMTTVALTASVAIDVLATAGLVWLAGGIYERAILRIGAPVKLRRVLARRPGRSQPAVLKLTGPRHAGWLEVTLRVVAVALVLAGVVIGFEHVVAIVLTGLGILLIAVLQGRRHGPRKSAH